MHTLWILYFSRKIEYAYSMDTLSVEEKRREEKSRPGPAFNFPILGLNNGINTNRFTCAGVKDTGLV